MVEKFPDFYKKIPSGSTLILTATVSNHEKELYMEAVKAIANPEFDNFIWICYQKAPEDVIEHLSMVGATTTSINKIHFIDMLSHMLGLEQKNNNASYCMSPTDYNCLLRSMEQQYANGERCLIIFDNLNALMSYDVIERMIRFIRNLNNLTASNKSDILYLGIAGGTSHEVEVAIDATMDNIYQIPENTTNQSKVWNKLKNTSWTDVFTLNAPLVFLLLITLLVLNITLLFSLLFIVGSV